MAKHLFAVNELLSLSHKVFSYSNVQRTRFKQWLADKCNDSGVTDVQRSQYDISLPPDPVETRWTSWWEEIEWWWRNLATVLEYIKAEMESDDRSHSVKFDELHAFPKWGHVFLPTHHAGGAELAPPSGGAELAPPSGGGDSSLMQRLGGGGQRGPLVHSSQRTCWELRLQLCFAANDLRLLKQVMVRVQNRSHTVFETIQEWQELRIKIAGIGVDEELLNVSTQQLLSRGGGERVTSNLSFALFSGGGGRLLWGGWLAPPLGGGCS